MGSAMNGMALYGSVIPFGGTFQTFSDYMRPAIRLAALSHIRVLFVFTHDSIGLGEDGPTHQSVEHLAALRAIPNLAVIRPCDAHETREAWRAALLRRHGPTVVRALAAKGRWSSTAKNSPTQAACTKARTSSPKPTTKNGKAATASDHHRHRLRGRPRDGGTRRTQRRGIPTRVVSMPCWEFFDEQSARYKESVLPPTSKPASPSRPAFPWLGKIRRRPRRHANRRPLRRVSTGGRCVPGLRVYGRECH